MSASFVPSPTTGRTRIFCHSDKNATLRRSVPATWTLPRIAHRSNNISSKITPGIRREHPLGLCRHLQHTTLKPSACGSRGALGNALRNASAALSGKIDDIGAALSPAKVDIIVVRRRKCEVPRGRRVSERMWAEFINNGNRKVTFSPIVEVRFEVCVGEGRVGSSLVFFPSKQARPVELSREIPTPFVWGL